MSKSPDSALGMQQIFAAAPRWFCPKSRSNTIQYLRIGLMRNLKDYNFSGWSQRQQRGACYSTICGALKKLEVFADAAHFTMVDLSNAEKSLLLERELIDEVLAARNEDCGVFINKSMDVVAQVNAGEHLQLYVYCAPNKIEQAFERLNQLDDLLEAELDYAFEPGLGYLNSDPKCLGEGLQISGLLHMPALARTTKLFKFVDACNALGYRLNDRYRYDAGPCGDYYMLSTHHNNGMDAQQLLAQFVRLLQQLQKLEQQAVKELSLNVNLEESFVHPSMQELQKPELCAGAMLNIISNLRLCKKCGWDELELDLELMYQNMVFLLPASMQFEAMLQNTSTPDYKKLRAQKLRSAILHE